MTSRVLNFLWINLDLPPPPDPDDGTIRQPLPLKYIENVHKAGNAHPDTQMVLWVDSRRLTERQYGFLQDALEEGHPNVQLKDLRSIPAYDTERLFNEAEKDPHWRSGGQTALIWRQVDAAKVLVSLQGDFDQHFFADLDHAHLDVASKQVQDMLDKHGIMIGSAGASYVNLENQLWGFSRERKGFFEDYYKSALKCAYAGNNAWSNLKDKVYKELQEKEGIQVKDICLLIDGDGSHAEQPGHSWRGGYGAKKPPSVIKPGELKALFNERSKKPDAKEKVDLDKVYASPVHQSPIARFFGKLRDTLKSSVGMA